MVPGKKSVSVLEGPGGGRAKHTLRAKGEVGMRQVTAWRTCTTVTESTKRCIAGWHDLEVATGELLKPRSSKSSLGI